MIHLHHVHLFARDDGRGAVHHVEIRTTDLAGLHRRCSPMGTSFRSGIRKFGTRRYLMCPAPNDVLLELFEIDVDSMPPELARYFNDETAR